jgi:hypothetical protein
MLLVYIQQQYKKQKEDNMENWIHITFQNTNTDQVVTDSINTDDVRYLANAISQWVANGWIILGIEFDEQIQAQTVEMSEQDLEDMAAYFAGGEQ